MSNNTQQPQSSEATAQKRQTPLRGVVGEDSHFVNGKSTQARKKRLSREMRLQNQVFSRGHTGFAPPHRKWDTPRGTA